MFPGCKLKAMFFITHVDHVLSSKLSDLISPSTLSLVVQSERGTSAAIVFTSADTVSVSDVTGISVAGEDFDMDCMDSDEDTSAGFP